MVTVLSVIVVAAVLFAAWKLIARLRADRISAIMEKHRGSSKVVSPGEFVDGNRHLPVALALTPATLFYENPDMQASLDLEFVREIEYDDELATGGAVRDGSVLRLRCSSQTFEFVVPNAAVGQWRQNLPPGVHAA